MPGTEDTVYCYAPHRRGVEHEVSRLWQRRVNVRGIDNHDGLNAIAGVRGGLFFNIGTHPERPPQRLWDELRARGFNVLTFDDRWARERWEHDAVRSRAPGVKLTGQPSVVIKARGGY